MREFGGDYDSFKDDGEICVTSLNGGGSFVVVLVEKTSRWIFRPKFPAQKVARGNLRGEHRSSFYALYSNQHSRDFIRLI